MDSDDYRTLAFDLFAEAYEHQVAGDLEIAADLYARSIETYPTAEAHTFLGWALGSQGKLDEAIAECKKAIRLDPDFGNPYNDIGAYLIQKEQYREAIPWLLQATQSKRYENRYFAHFNLGRAYVATDLYNMALEEFETALRLAPDYQPARETLNTIIRRIQ